MRTVFGVAAILLTAGSARADQLIQIPTADRVPGFAAEYLHRVEGRSEGYGTAFIPAGLAFELMFRHYNNLDFSHDVEGGGMLQLLPDGIVTPGIAVGVWDVTNSSPWGRRAFLVLTKGIDQGQWGAPPFIRRTQLTLGLGTGRFGGPLAGIRFDLPARFSLIAEYDSRRLNAGVRFSPVKPLILKAELQNGIPFVGGEFRTRL